MVFPSSPVANRVRNIPDKNTQDLEPPPWEEKPFDVIIQNTTPKKINQKIAASEARKRILDLNSEPAINIFTDASQRTEGETGWAAFIPELDTTLQGRLPNYTPITLAELEAIHQVIDFIKNHKGTDIVNIHTDSMGALQLIRNHPRNTYPETTSAIIQAVWTDPVNHYNFHWLPSHTGIEENDIVDLKAKEATSIEDIQPIEDNPGHLFTTSTKFVDAIPQPEEEASATTRWYHDTTIQDRKLLDGRRIDIQIRRLRFSTYCHGSQGPLRCSQCQEIYSPTHYLVACPARPRLRQKLLQMVPMDLHHRSDQTKAATILRQLQLDPSPIQELTELEPYMFQK